MGKQKPNGYWNIKQNCLDEANKYQKRCDFKRGSNGAYEASIRNGWYDEICKHMIIGHIYVPNFDYESCMDLALKCESRKEFKTKYNSAYNFCRKKGWLDDMYKHMIETIKPHGYWTLENVMIEAQKFTSRKDFCDKSMGGAYGAAQRNGWLNLISDHMEIKGNRYNRLIYVYEFEDKSAYIGLTYNMKVRQAQRDKCKSDQVTKYKLKTGLIPIRKELTEYIDYRLAAKLECQYIQEYRDSGWNVLNVSSGGNTGSEIRKWSIEKVNNFIDQLRYYHKILEVCPHFFAIIKKKGYEDSLNNIIITIDGIELNYLEYYKSSTSSKNELIKTKYLEIISKYDNIDDFKINESIIYDTIIRRRGWDKLIKPIGYVKQMKHGARDEYGNRIYPKSRYRQYQDIERVKQEISKYKTYTELCENDGVLAAVIRDNNWGYELLGELHSNKPQKYYIKTEYKNKLKERYKTIISQYVNFIDFNRDHNWEYQSIIKNNWIELLDNLIFIVNYIAVNHDVYSKSRYDIDFKIEFTKLEYSKIISKYNELNKFKSENRQIFNFIMKNKWGGELFFNLTRENKAKLHKYDNKEFVIDELKKYKTFTDLKRGDLPLLNRIKKNGWEDELLCEINKTKLKSNYWNFETCSNAAKLCRCRSEFKLKYGQAHKLSSMNNWLDEICLHMLTEKEIREERLQNKLNNN